MIENWSGPISIAIFVDDIMGHKIIVQYMKYLQNCFPKFQNQVSAHLVFPSDYQLNRGSNLPALPNESCAKSEKWFKNHYKKLALA